MKQFMKSLCIPVLVFITLMIFYLTWGHVITAEMFVYDHNFDFFRSLTAEQSQMDNVCVTAKVLVATTAIPLVLSTTVWMALFFVQRKKLRELTED